MTFNLKLAPLMGSHEEEGGRVRELYREGFLCNRTWGSFGTGVVAKVSNSPNLMKEVF